MKTNEYKVQEEQELMEFLTRTFKETSKTKIKEILQHSVWVDGRKVTQYNFALKPGMRVTIERTKGKERWSNPSVEIVFEDKYLLVVDKHEGVLSNSKNVADRTVQTILNSYLEHTHQRCRAHVVHRLDRDTSGLMVFAKSKEVSRKFEEDWKGTVYDRAYVAVVWGKLEPKTGTIRTWLTDGEFCVLSSPTDNGGKEAITHYEVKRTSRRYSLVELRLDTGRRNQIRVHMRELQHPVVKDPMYGYKEDVSPIDRLGLHAFRLCFKHPVTGKDMQFETPYPKSFVRLMEL